MTEQTPGTAGGPTGDVQYDEGAPCTEPTDRFGEGRATERGSPGTTPGR
jgi:hypothetical protein